MEQNLHLSRRQRRKLFVAIIKALEKSTKSGIREIRGLPTLRKRVEVLRVKVSNFKASLNQRPLLEDRRPSFLEGRITDLNAPLLYFDVDGQNSRDPRNYWRLRDAVRGVQIMGGIGSGKSSGSGRLLALTYLKSGWGGVVFTGKINEVEAWRKYARMTNRSEDLVIIEKGSDLFFNPLQYEAMRSGSGKGETLNLVNLIMSIYEMSQGFSAGGGGSNNERFWDGQ